MKRVVKYVIITILVLMIMLLGISFYVKLSTKNRVVEDYSKLSDIDAIIILGAGVKKNNRPSNMLEDRLIKGLELYNNEVSNKIIVSGDHGRIDYDEVNTMKSYIICNGVDSSNVFMDHAGFSTYDSIYRAKEIFVAKKVVIVSQEYHLYRALFIADKLGLEAYGVKADEKKYRGDTYRKLREILARDKDFFKAIIKPKPTYLGDVIPVSTDGNATNDK